MTTNRIKKYIDPEAPVLALLTPGLIEYLKRLTPEQAKIERRFAHQILHIIRQNGNATEQMKASALAMEARIRILKEKHAH